MQSVDGDDGHKGASLTGRAQHGMCRSCDACRRKKKRCDQGQPCSRCVRSNDQCTYSKRRWHQPGQHLHRQRSYPWQNNGDAVHVREDLFHSTSGWIVERRMLPFKRCRLRASPATGLVGMQENDFLSDFFGCVGFLPLTSKSQIREAMVKIMVPATSRPNSEYDVQDGRFGTLLGWRTFNTDSGMDQLSRDPSSATFWAAVAMGALAKGCPFEAVERYCQLAREALATCRSGSSCTELARASAILTYLYSFRGDMANFREYLDLSERFLQASIEQGSPDLDAGLFYLVRHCSKVGNLHTGPMDISRAREEAPLQLDEVTTDRDLYLFVAQSFRAFDQAVYAKARDGCSGDLERSPSCGPVYRHSDPNDPLPAEVSEALATVFDTTNSLELEPLEESADRPSIRAGIGDLLINGTLVFAKAAKGDLYATLEKLDRSIKVYERYPGLCRCMMGCHISHMMLATLAEIGDSRARGMYDRLQGAVNFCRATHSMPVPPLDEWQGMATICSDLHCRAIGALVKSEHMKVFKTPPAGSTRDSTDPTQTASDPHGETKSEALPASVAPVEIVAPVRACSGSGWIGSNETSRCVGNQDPAGAVWCADAALVPLASRSDPSSPSYTKSDSPSTSNVEATKGLCLFSGTAGSGGHHDDNSEPKDDDVSSSDWLEVAHAMSDAVHAA